MASKVKASLSGDKALLKELRRLEKKAPGAVERALYQQGIAIIGNAIRRAPVQFGVLRGAAYVAPPMEAPGGAIVQLGFGTVYAAAQHEGEDFNHPRGGEAKYLEKAVASEASPKRIADWAKENIAKGLSSTSIPGAPPKKPVVKESVRRRGLARKKRQASKAKERSRRRSERRDTFRELRKAKSAHGRATKKAARRERRSVRRLLRKARASQSRADRKASQKERARARRAEKRQAKRAAKSLRRYEARQRESTARIARRLRKAQSLYERKQRKRQRKAQTRVRRQQRRAYAAQRRKEAKRISRLNRKMRKDLARLAKKRKGTKKRGRRRNRKR
jgi:hypothetical protein